jgi:hypothetical protein
VHPRQLCKRQVYGELLYVFMIFWMAVINLRMSSVFLKLVGAERPRGKDIRTINIFDFPP